MGTPNKPGPNKDYNLFDTAVYKAELLTAKFTPTPVLKVSATMNEALGPYIGSEALADAQRDVIAERERALPAEVDKKPAPKAPGVTR